MERIKTAAEIYTDELDPQDQLTKVQEFVQDQNHCCLCGSELTFHHKMDHLTLTIEEDAKCDSCHISLRTKNHHVQ
jgi:hypothetical protein